MLPKIHAIEIETGTLLNPYSVVVIQDASGYPRCSYPHPRWSSALEDAHIRASDAGLPGFVDHEGRWNQIDSYPYRLARLAREEKKLQREAEIIQAKLSDIQRKRQELLGDSGLSPTLS